MHIVIGPAAIDTFIEGKREHTDQRHLGHGLFRQTVGIKVCGEVFIATEEIRIADLIVTTSIIALDGKPVSAFGQSQCILGQEIKLAVPEFHTTVIRLLG